MAGAPNSRASSGRAGSAGARHTGPAAGWGGMAAESGRGGGGHATAREPGGAGAPVRGRGGSAGDSGGWAPSAGQGGLAGDSAGWAPSAGQGALGGDGGSTGADSAAGAGQGGRAETASASVRSEEKLRVVRGQSGVLTVVVTRGAGQEGAIELTLQTALGGVGAAPATIAAGATAAQLTVETVASALVGGPYPFTVTATLVGSSTPMASFSGSLYVAQEPGTLDSSFGPSASGTVRPVVPVFPASYPGQDDLVRVHDLAVDAQGRVLVAGASTHFSGATRTGWVVRLVPSGEVDPSFGDAGFVTGFGARWSEARRVAVEGDELFVSVGCSDDTPTSYVRQLDSVGVPDSTFGTGGDVVVSDSDDAVGGLIAYSKGLLVLVQGESIVWLDAQGTQVRTTGHSHDGSTLAMDAQERVLVGYPSGLDINLYRLLPTGKRDEGFGPDAAVTTSCSADAYRSSVYAVLPAADGATLALVGCAVDSLCDSEECLVFEVALHAFSQDGVPLNGYGSDGRAVVADQSQGVFATMQPDSKPLIAYRDTDRQFHLVRFQPNGSVDTSFGAEGIVELSPDLLSQVVALAYEPEGHRVVLLLYGDGQFAVARYWL